MKAHARETLIQFLAAFAGVYERATILDAAGKFSGIPTEPLGRSFAKMGWHLEEGCEEWERFPLVFTSYSGDGLFVDAVGRVGWLVMETAEVRIWWGSLAEAVNAFARKWMAGEFFVDSWSFARNS